MRVWLVIVLILAGNIVFAQNVGVGTTSPTAKLHVAGKVKTDSAVVVTPISKTAAASITISNNAGYIIITSTSGTQANAIGMSGVAHAGQLLCIMNDDDDDATFASVNIPAGKLVLFTYTGASWEALSALSMSSAYLSDADIDTKVHVEESTDEDKVRIDIAGTQQWLFENDRLETNGTNKNVNIGLDAGSSSGISLGTNGVAIGYQARRLSSGTEVIGIGTEACENCDQNYDIGIGQYALQGGSNQGENIGIGRAALQLTPDRGNTAIGYLAMNTTSLGWNNVAIGKYSLRSANHVSGTVAIGYNAGRLGGGGSVYIGHEAGANTADSFRLYIANSNTASPLIYGEFNNQILEINGDLRPGANNTRSLGSSLKKWTVVYAQNGTIQTSDVRFKINIQNLNYGLNDLMQLRSVRYNWKTDSTGQDKIGFLAQELEQVIPEVVMIGDDSLQTRGVNYAELIPVLVNAIQEQQRQIEDYKMKIENAAKTNAIQDQKLADIEAKLSLLLNATIATK